MAQKGKIAKVIERYLLEKDTDYAIMINGEWGCGKTFFVNHELDSILNTISYNSGSDKDHPHYEKIYVSLYGVASKEDIYSAVFQSLNPNWDKLLRYSTPFMQRTLGFFGLSWGEKINKDLITRIKPHQVLVFDDLERISTTFEAQDALSVINNYTEHLGIKTIIICYEDKNKGIQEYKEKSVRYTLAFAPDMAHAYESIIAGFENDYRVFCKEKSSIVLRYMFLADTKNLRILKFILTSFQEIYELLKDSTFSKELLEESLLFYSLCAIESRFNVTKDQLSLLNSEKWRLDLDWFPGHEDKKKERTYDDDFWDKYQECRDGFKFSEVLLDYIWDGSVDEVVFDKWKKGREGYYQRMQETPQGKVYKKLLNIAGLSDGESPSLIEEMFSYIKEDKYNLYDLMSIYALLLKFDHWSIDGFKLTDEHDSIIQQAMENRKGSHVYNSSFEIKIPVWDARSVDRSITERYDKMKVFACRINYGIKKSEDNKIIDKLFKSIGDNEFHVVTQICKEHNGHLLRSFDWNRAGEIISEGSSPQACCLADVIMGQLEVGESLLPDGEKVVREEFIPCIEKTIKERPNSPRKMYIAELLQSLQRFKR